MRTSGAAASARFGSACACGTAVFPRPVRGEHGKLFFQFGGTTMRAFSPLPVGRADQHFAVAFTTVAMEFVNREGFNIKCGLQAIRADVTIKTEGDLNAPNHSFQVSQPVTA